MDVNSAVKLVLKKALAHDGLCRGLRETTRAIEKHQAQLCILAEDCDQPDYKKLVEALCAENNVNLLSVPEAKQLGQWAGVSAVLTSSKSRLYAVQDEETVVPFMQLCKIDQEGEARKVVGCSSVVVTVSYAVLQLLNCAVIIVGWMDLKLGDLQDYGEETEGHSVLQEYLKNKN